MVSTVPVSPKIIPASKPLRVGFLTRYAENGASSRVRAMQFAPLLAQQGLRIEMLPLLGTAYLVRQYQGKRNLLQVLTGYLGRLGNYFRLWRCDVLWLEKELFPFVPYPVEAAFLLGRKFVLDFDDAIFHNYDLSRSPSVVHLLGDKIDRLMRRANIVTAGNAYLAKRALRAGAARVEQLPSAIDLERYPRPDLAWRATQCASSRVQRIVWIGSPATAHYLELIKIPIERLAARRSLEFHVIGAPAPDWSGVRCLAIEWSAQTEVAALSHCDIGVMPLADTPWEQGKCSFKLIQYMACGLPVVASPVGMNLDVVRPDANGLLAVDDAQWESALERLLDDPALRLRMAEQGRRDVEERYNIQVIAPKMAALLREAAEQR